MKNILPTQRSIVLLVVLLTSIIASAFSEYFGGGSILFVAHILLGVGGAYLLRAGRSWHTSVWVLVAITTVLEMIALNNKGEWESVELTSRFFTMLFIALMFGIVLKYSLLSETRIHKVDRILAGICGYLLIALFWAHLCFAIEIISEGAFRDPNGEKLTRVDFMYFSLLTVTSLGYGDIVPVSSPARILSVLETVFGTLYLAVFISSLVAMPGKKES